MKDKVPNFFKWIFKKWSFWALFVLWSLWSGYEELFILKSLAEFIGTVTATFIMSMFLFIIFYIFYRNGYNEKNK